MQTIKIEVEDTKKYQPSGARGTRSPSALGLKNGQQGLEKGVTIGYWAIRSTFDKRTI